MSYGNAGQYGPQAVLFDLGSGVPSLLRSTAITVKTSGGATAQLFTDRTAGTAASNPVSTDASGNLSFFAAPGAYTLNYTTLAGAVSLPITVQLDPADKTPDVFGTSAASNPNVGVRTKERATTQHVTDSISESAITPWLISPPASLFAASAASAWYTANAATLMRFGLERPRTFRYVNLYVGTQSGNIQVGVVRLRPGNLTTTTDFELVQSSGVIACPAAGNARLDLGFFTLTPGEYALFLWCDNTTATFLHGLATGINASRLTFANTNIASGILPGINTASVTTRWVSGLTLEAPNLPITLLGDSITANDAAGVGSGGAWFSNADQATGYRFYPITNNGVAGERSDQILARAAAAFSGKRYATILAGTNDIGQNIDPNTTISNLGSILSAAVSAGLQSFVIGTIPPRVGTGGLGTSLTATQIQSQHTVNAWIRANYSSYVGARLVDWSWALSDGSDESSPLLANFADGIHPNATGSSIMTGLIRKSIRDWS